MNNTSTSSSADKIPTLSLEDLKKCEEVISENFAKIENMFKDMFKKYGFDWDDPTHKVILNLENMDSSAISTFRYFCRQYEQKVSISSYIKDPSVFAILLKGMDIRNIIKMEEPKHDL